MDYLNTAEVTRFVLIILVILLTFLSWQVACQALVPDFVRRCQAEYDRPIRVGLWGLGLLLVAVLLVGMLTKLVPFLGAVLGILSFLLALTGSAGLARRIGTGLASPSDKDMPWRRTLRGGIVLCGLNMLIVVGQAIIFIGGLGAAVLALRRLRKERNTADKDPEEDGESDS